jgi:hypothetical protein
MKRLIDARVLSKNGPFEVAAGLVCRTLNQMAVGRLLHQQGWRTEFTVEQMVSDWGQLVAMVERGYDDSIYEYLNDLSCRDWVYDAWQLRREVPARNRPCRRTPDHGSALR